MAVITISRQFASGGSIIGEKAARALGWTLIDNEFVDRVAQRAGLPREEVAERDEKTPGLIERLARTLAVTNPEVFLAGGDDQPIDVIQTEPDVIRVTQAVINEAVGHGNAVLVGRGAQAYLAEREEVLHVFVTASRAQRMEWAMERLGLSREQAASTLDETDEQRRRYVKTYYGRHWGEATDYHLVINSGFFGFDGAATLVITAARARFTLPAT